TCRGCNSRDPEPCERFLHSRKVVIPMYAPQHRLSAFVLDGLRAGLAEARLNGDLLELTAALRIALDIPQASDRCLAREPLFPPARLTCSNKGDAPTHASRETLPASVTIWQNSLDSAGSGVLGHHCAGVAATTGAGPATTADRTVSSHQCRHHLSR